MTGKSWQLCSWARSTSKKSEWEEKWRLENNSRGRSTMRRCRGQEENCPDEIRKKGRKESAERRKDINYSRKQEQQIPIKDDWQMPSCFKCLLRLVIVIRVCCLMERASGRKGFLILPPDNMIISLIVLATTFIFGYVCCRYYSDWSHLLLDEHLCVIDMRQNFIFFRSLLWVVNSFYRRSFGSIHHQLALSLRIRRRSIFIVT